MGWMLLFTHIIEEWAFMVTCLILKDDLRRKLA